MIDTVREIRSLRDRIAAENMTVTGGLSRERAMAITKLDEAAQWLIEAGVSEGRMLLIDKHEYRERLEATRETATEKTYETI